MKIKLAVLHGDKSYLDRLISILGNKYRDKLSLYSFTNLEIALASLSKEKIDVFLADNAFEINIDEVPSKCGFAYFVDSPEVESVKGVPAICQFQRVELLYKNILQIFSETIGDMSVRNLHSNSTKVLIFASPCGGTGTSTLAASCALHFSLEGKRCLYLNLENFGGADAYFSGDGSADMSDVVYAVKSKRGGLAIKLESYVRQDNHGVYYFATAKVALDMMELTVYDQVELISVLVGSGKYDVIVVDTDFSLQKENLELFDLAHALVWVSDGLPVSNFKIMRAYRALQVLEESNHMTMSERICLIQNKIAAGASGTLAESDIHCAGTILKLRHRADEQIIGQLATSSAFHEILEI